jgi:Flp pilus assembly protein TadG
MSQTYRVAGRRTVALPRASDRGAVLLETALAIPLLMAVAVALAWALSLAATSASLGDAARTAARAFARGEAEADVLARAHSAVPNATVAVDSAAPDVAVVVSQEVSPPVPLLSGLSITLTSRVVIPREWA